MKAIASVLASIVGSEIDVCDWDQDAGRQKTILSSLDTPDCIVYPQTPEQLAQVMAAASSQQWRVLPCGSGSKLNWGGLAAKIDLVISTERLNHMIDHAVGDLTVTVEAGMKFADLQTTLASQGQFLALDPFSPAQATIGGIVATADTGSWRQRYGGVRDQLLGITFVRADGQIAAAGGRVVKNVAGYDLMKLFTGSYGTLGILTQMTFRVYPQPATSGTVVLTGAEADIAVAAASLMASALTPTAADLLSTELVSSLGLGKGMGLIARFQSIAESVHEQANILLHIGKNHGLSGTIYTEPEEVDFWDKWRSLIHDNAKTAVTCKIGVLPTAAVKILSQVSWGLIHMSSGLGWLRLDESQVLEMRSLCAANGGFLSILTGSVTVKQGDVWGYSGNSLGVMRLLKREFDPHNLLSPGRFVGGI